MPFKGLLCPGCGEKLNDRATSIAHLWTPLHGKRLVAPGVIEAIWVNFDNSNDARRQGVHFTPSMAGGCQREHVISRAVDTWLDPRKAWKMLQGTLWHEVLEKYAPPGWRGEVEIPSARVAELIQAGKQDSLPSYIRPRDGAVWEIEVLPGIWVSIKLDLLRDSDPWTIVDYKIKDCPPGWRDKQTGELVYASGPPLALFRGYTLQQNIYAHAVKKTYGLDELPKMVICSNYAGMQDPNRNWEFIEVEPLSEDVLLSEIKGDVELYKTYARKVAVEGIEAARPMPLQGLMMFGGKKCTKYCAVKDICDGIGSDTPSGWDL